MRVIIIVLLLLSVDRGRCHSLKTGKAILVQERWEVDLPTRNTRFVLFSSSVPACPQLSNKSFGKRATFQLATHISNERPSPHSLALINLLPPPSQPVPFHTVSSLSDHYPFHRAQRAFTSTNPEQRSTG